MPLDFERDDLFAVLSEHGYRADARTFFVWEGVTQYLTEDAVRTTLAALQAAPTESPPVFTYVRGDFIDGRNMYGAQVLYKRFRQRQQVWKFGLEPDDVAAFVGDYGWRLVEQAGPDYYQQQLHLDRPDVTWRPLDLEWAGVLRENPPLGARRTVQSAPLPSAAAPRSG